MNDPIAVRTEPFVRSIIIIIVILLAGCTGRTPRPLPLEASGSPVPPPAPTTSIASAWLLGSGGFMGHQCVSVWVDSGRAASLQSLSADEHSFRLDAPCHHDLFGDLAQAWPLADPGSSVPGDDLIRYTLLLTGTDGSTRRFSYTDGAPKPPVLQRIHEKLLSIAAPR